LSDTSTPDSHEKYVDYYTTDATLIMGITKAVGRDEIFQIRKRAWETVATRLHTIDKIFPFGDKNQEFMLYGGVDVAWKDGRKAYVEWAARVHMVQEGEKWKMGFYQVYLDSAAIPQAK